MSEPSSPEYNLGPHAEQVKRMLAEVREEQVRKEAIRMLNHEYNNYMIAITKEEEEKAFFKMLDAYKYAESNLGVYHKITREIAAIGDKMLMKFERYRPIKKMHHAYESAVKTLGEDHKVTLDFAARLNEMLSVAEEEIQANKKGGKKQKSRRRKSRKSRKSIRRRR